VTVSSIFRFTVYGESYEEILSNAEYRISEFFEVNLEDVSKKFNYELDVRENIDMLDGNPYEAEVIVRGRNV
jgi:hypothetical protein